MTLDHEIIEALRYPFEAHEHSFEGGYLHLTEFPITARLDEIDPNWSFEIQSISHRMSVGTTDNLIVTVQGRLTVCGVTRDGVGMWATQHTKRRTNRETGEVTDATEANKAEKNAATDALKRAARLFGIGRYLLKVPRNIKSLDDLERWLEAALAAKAQRNGG